VVAKICSTRRNPMVFCGLFPAASRHSCSAGGAQDSGSRKGHRGASVEAGDKDGGDLTAMARAPAGADGRLGVALAAKAAGIDAGGWFDEAIGEDSGPKSVSHEHTFSVDVSDRRCSRLHWQAGRESLPPASRTRAACRRIQLKLRFADFSTFYPGPHAGAPHPDRCRAVASCA